MRINVFIFFIGFMFLNVHLSAREDEGYSYRISPYIRNITKNEYNAANQNWSISQSKEGFIYVANRRGLLEYNGYSWEKYPLEGSYPLRSVLAANDDRVYYGHFEDFGYFKRNDYGRLDRYSISDSLLERNQLVNENIWTILEIDNKIYFRSFGKIFIYDKERVKVVSPGNTVYSLFEYKGRATVNIIPEGLFYLDSAGVMHKEYLPDNITHKRIIRVIPINSVQDILITEFDGIYLREGMQCRKWEGEVNTVLDKFQINKCAVINKELIAVGTIGSGIILFNRQGEITGLLDKITGLNNNTVLAMHTDQSNNLWIGLDNGIDFIELNSPFKYCFDRPGSLGAVYTASLYNDRLYIGTNQGLFYTPWTKRLNKSSIRFKKIEQAQGQVWDLVRIDDKLICNYNLGVLQIDSQSIRKIGMVGGFTAILHPTDNHTFYQGNYSGVLKFTRDQQGNWKEDKWMFNSLGGAAFLTIDQFNNLWVAENFTKIWKFRLNNTNDSIVYAQELGETGGLNTRWSTGVFEFDNRTVFSNHNRFFTYNYNTKRVELFEWLNKNLDEYMNSQHIYNTDVNEYWFTRQDKVGLFSFENEHFRLIKEIPYNTNTATAVDDYQNIHKIDSVTYIIGLDNGFMIYESGQKPVDYAKNVHSLKLTSASCYNEKDKRIELEVVSETLFEIPYRYRNIIFNFAMPGMLPENYTISYRLDNGKWLTNRNSRSVKFNYLKPGKHILSVRSLDEGQKVLSGVSYEIKVMPPWMLTGYAMGIYIMIASGLVYLLIVFNRYRLKKQKLAYLKKLKSDNTRRIIRTKNVTLKKEIENKSAELANYTVILKKKNEVLIQIKDMLDNSDWVKEGAKDKGIVDIYKTIQHNLSDKDDWKIFSAHFDEAHSNFLKKIKNDHPGLTPNDLQLCAFLKMMLSTKEIASLLNISSRSVEVKRYRLRKKLGLGHEVNLVEYLLEV